LDEKERLKWVPVSEVDVRLNNVESIFKYNLGLMQEIVKELSKL